MPAQPGQAEQGIVSDRIHANYNGAVVTGVEKREIKIPIILEIQKQAVDLNIPTDKTGTGGGALSAAGSSPSWGG
jgi:hypothetical protein